MGNKKKRPVKIHHLSVDAALHSLHTADTGLDAAEAARRLREYGPNQVAHITETPLYRRFIRGFTHFFALILFVAAFLAFFADWRDPSQGMFALGWAILGVILVTGLFSFWQEYRTSQTLAALEQLLPVQVNVLRDQHMVNLPASNLVPGDVLLLEEGDSVPADCRVIKSFSLRVNNATVTGESRPRACNATPSSEEDIIHARNVVLAGTSVVSGRAQAVVFATGNHTEFGQIAGLTQSVHEQLSPLQREIVRLTRILAILAVTLGVVFFSIGQWIGLPFWANFVFAIGIIVANVPEGLLPTVTLSLAMAAQRMARRNALIRHLPSVETLGTTTVICTDKTGTLTLNQMTVEQLYVGGHQFTCGDFLGTREILSAHRELLACAGLCHNLKALAGNILQGDPMEMALQAISQQAGWQADGSEMYDEVPFDSDRKRMSVLHQTPDGLMLYTKGALETVLPLCQQWQPQGQVVALDDTDRDQTSQAAQRMAEQGLRVLALAWRRMTPDITRDAWEQELVFAGLVGLEDPPRPEVPEAIRRCHSAGIRVIMITGDEPHTAQAIAREIGLVRSEQPVIIIGDQLRRMSKTQLQLALDAPEILFARVTADQKLRIVSALKRKGEVVAVTGDGVNDAPALKHADIGIAMGRGGSDVARQAADMVLVDDNFASIVAAVEEGRAVYQNIRKFMTYILSSNIPEVIPYLAFVLFRIPLPLTVVQILVVDLGTDMLPALGLGAERPEAHIMQQPPRSRHERLLSWPLLVRAYLFLGMMEAVAAMAAFFYVLNSGGWQWGLQLAWNNPLYLEATTACLATIVVMQVVNVFICRSETRSVFSGRWLHNHWILAGIAVELTMIAIIAYTPWANTVFGTAPLAPEVWLFMLPFAAGMLALEELRKWVVRQWWGK